MEQKTFIETIKERHELHAPLIGGITYLGLRNQTKNAPVIAIGVTVASYLYMRNFDHRLASVGEIKNAMGFN